MLRRGIDSSPPWLLLPSFLSSRRKRAWGISHRTDITVSSLNSDTMCTNRAIASGLERRLRSRAESQMREMETQSR